jgi:hypothetical protein
VKGSEYGGCNSVFMYENRRMKRADIVLRSGGERMRKTNGWVNLIKMYCKHICKYHNVFPLYNYYMLTKKTLSKKKN